MWTNEDAPQFIVGMSYGSLAGRQSKLTQGMIGRFFPIRPRIGFGNSIALFQ